MPHPKPRMSAFLEVTWWTAEPVNQKVSQTLFRTWEIILRVQGTENIVTGYLAVEVAN